MIILCLLYYCLLFIIIYHCHCDHYQTLFYYHDYELKDMIVPNLCKLCSCILGLLIQRQQHILKLDLLVKLITFVSRWEYSPKQWHNRILHMLKRPNIVS